MLKHIFFKDKIDPLMPEIETESSFRMILIYFFKNLQFLCLKIIVLKLQSDWGKTIIGIYKFYIVQNKKY